MLPPAGRAVRQRPVRGGEQHGPAWPVGRVVAYRQAPLDQLLSRLPDDVAAARVAASATTRR